MYIDEKIKINKNKKSIGIYVHFPFCESKCKYCGFLSFAEKKQSEKSLYLNLLNKEIVGYSEDSQIPTVVDTVFIGGGTPSLMLPEEIKILMDTLKCYFDIDECSEITIETNPNSIDEEKLKAYKASGINRLSMGLQSMDNVVLKALGRVHDKEEFLKKYKLARRLGFDNINIDLMFGVPKQSFEIWKETLDETIALEPEHISFYSLQLEPKTVFYDQYKNGIIDLADDQLERKMYHYAIEKLTLAGYIHYEISNAAKSGYECKHNLKYWDMSDFLGVGLGASSYVNGNRYKNVDEVSQWEQLVSNKMWPIDFSSYHVDTKKEKMAIFIFTGLRTRKGVDLREFNEKFGMEFVKAYREKMDVILTYKKDGLLEYNGKILCLTEKGIDLSNEIMSNFV